jgi:3-hydroxybutyryl-CoA dehydrogenase
MDQFVQRRYPASGHMTASATALSTQKTIGVIGCGTMGIGIAQVAAAAGHPVVVYDSLAGAAPRAIESLHGTFEKLASKGKLSAEDAAKASARLRGASNLQDFRGASLIIEAVVENLEIKQRLFSELETIVDEQCILASNTSSISITAVGAALKNPRRFLGMHFFNPAPLMELVEIISGVKTDATCLAAAYETSLAWGKSPVHARSSPGFIVNRIARPFYGEALLLLYEQAGSPSTIDAVMRESAGFRMGPCELMDLVGLDVNLAVTKSVFNAFFGDTRYRPSLIQQEMVDAGFLGRKTKRGFYDYSEGAVKPEPDTEATQPKPARVVLPPGSNLAGAVGERLNGSGIEIVSTPSRANVETWIEVGEALIAITEGKTASQIAHETGHANIVLVDLALDYAKARRLGIARADRCDENAYRSAVGLLQAAGYAVSRVRDVPGIVAMRTVAMLVNEAADVLNQGVATAADVDLAVCKGLNYPQGPLAWGNDLGVGTVHKVLANLGAHYGGERYRISPKIRHLFWTEGKFPTA